MSGAFFDLWRLARVARVLARHDALAALEGIGAAPPWLTRPMRLLARRGAPEKRLGEALADAAVALGPGFIKLGQALSTRADLIGARTAADLARLRDRLPPFPAEEARATVAVELGAPVESLFDSFDDRPVAAASIAQVHYAVASDGRPVAVKVLRPGIERAFRRDLELFLRIARAVERARPRWRRFRLVESVEVFADAVTVEMNLSLEGAAAAELAENFAGDASLGVPKVDWRRTARRVLTTERVEGAALGDAEALAAAGHDPADIVARAARATFNQVFRDGFFHGDPHPGNIFVAADGSLRLVDFGVMGRLDRATRRFLADVLTGFLEGDYARVAEAHFAMGFVSGDRSRGAFAQALRAIGEPIRGLPTGEISLGRLLGQLFRTAEDFGMPAQPQLLLLQKVMVVSEGVGRALHPGANMWELARPLVAGWAEAHMGPRARAREALDETAEFARRLPRMAAYAEAALERLAGAAAPAARAPLAPWAGGRVGAFLAGAAVAAAVIAGAARLF